MDISYHLEPHMKTLYMYTFGIFKNKVVLMSHYVIMKSHIQTPLPYLYIHRKHLYLNTFL